MPFHYSTEFRRRVCQRLLAGDPIKSMAFELSISQATLFRSIQELEDELALVKAASALFNGEERVYPKGGTRLPKH